MISETDVYTRKTAGNILYCVEHKIDLCNLSKVAGTNMLYKAIFPDADNVGGMQTLAKSFINEVKSLGYDSVKNILKAQPLEIILASHGRSLENILNTPYGRILIPGVYEIFEKLNSHNRAAYRNAAIQEIFRKNKIKYSGDKLSMLERVLKYNIITNDEVYSKLYGNVDREVRITKSYNTYTNNTVKCNNNLSFEMMDRVAQIAISTDDNNEVLDKVYKLVDEMGVTIKTYKKSVLGFIIEARAHRGILENLDGFCRDYKNIDLDRFKDKYQLDNKYKSATTFAQIVNILRNRMPNVSAKVSRRGYMNV